MIRRQIRQHQGAGDHSSRQAPSAEKVGIGRDHPIVSGLPVGDRRHHQRECEKGGDGQEHSLFSEQGGSLRSFTRDFGS